MIAKDQGIILSLSDYRENDALAQVFLKDHGRYSLIARGVKKYTSKKAYSVMPFCLDEFIFDHREGKEMAVMQSAALIKNYYRKEDLKQLSGLQLLSDIALMTYDSYDNLKSQYEDIYQAFEHSLTGRLEAVIAVYIAHVAERAGIAPMVDGCAICHDPRVVTISIRDGGFLCAKHGLSLNKIDPMRLKKFRLAHKVPWDYLDEMDKIGYDQTDLFLLADFFFHHADLKLRSYDFFKSLFQL